MLTAERELAAIAAAAIIGLSSMPVHRHPCRGVQARLRLTPALHHVGWAERSDERRQQREVVAFPAQIRGIDDGNAVDDLEVVDAGVDAAAQVH